MSEDVAQDQTQYMWEWIQCSMSLRYLSVYSRKAVPQMHSFCFLKKHLQPEVIPYILSKLKTELYPGNLSLTHCYIQDTREDNNGLPVVVVVDSHLRMHRCFHRMNAIKNWLRDRTQRRSECEPNFIRQSRVLKQWKKDKEIDTSSRLHNISHLSKRTPKNDARTKRIWYLIGKAADRCLLKVGYSDIELEIVLLSNFFWNLAWLTFMIWTLKNAIK